MPSDINDLNRLTDSPTVPAAPAPAPSTAAFPIACGISRHSIDNNGRFVIPSNFIREFGNSYYMTIDDANRIVLFPADRFRDLGRALAHKRSDDFAQEDVANAIDRIFAFAEYLNTDSSGRVQFTSTFRETLSEIKVNEIRVKEVPTGTAVIVGALDRILVLTEDEFKDYRKMRLSSSGGIHSHGQLMRMTYATYERQASRAAATGGS